MRISFTAVLTGVLMLFVVSSTRGQDNSEKILSMIERADSLHRANQLDSAITIANEAILAAKAGYEDSDTLVATAIYTLAKIHATAAEFSLAESLFTEVLKINEEALGPDHPRVADALRHIATIYKDQGKYPESEKSYLRAITIYETADEQDRTYLGTTLRDLAEVYHELGNYNDAELRYKQALEINERTLGTKNVEVGLNLASLGRLYVDLGKYVEAEQYYLRAQKIYEEVLGPDDPMLAKHLNNLGLLYHGQGRYEEARQNYQRALEIKEKAYGPDHPSVGVSLVNLGRFHLDKEEHEEALSYFYRSLVIFENALGPDHPAIGTITNNLGLTNNILGNYAEAEMNFERSLEVKGKTLGENHPKYALSLCNFGLFYFDIGNYDRAESTLTRALDIFENSLSPAYPDIEMILGYLAKTYCAQGKYEYGLKNYVKRQHFLENLYQYVFSYTSEDRKMSYISRYPILESSLLSLASEKNSPEINEAAFGMLLRGKAMVVDAISREREKAYCIMDREIKDNLETHTRVCGEISSLLLSNAFSSDPKVFRDSLEMLNNLKDTLETRLSMSCSEFKDELDSRKSTVADIAAGLPEGSVLWDIVQYKPYDFARIGKELERRGSPRYMAFKLSSGGSIESADLGDAALIDSLVTTCHRILREAPSLIYGGNEGEAERELSAVTGRLYELVFAPLEALLEGENRIFISPDAVLSLLPFEILPRPDGEYIIEKYHLSYLSSGRDLLKSKGIKESKDNNVLIVANPDYDFELITELAHKTKEPEGIGYAFSYQPVRGPSAGNECLKKIFQPLPGTYDEGMAIYNLFKNEKKFRAEFLHGHEASEESLKSRKEPPTIMHLATHGYFCPQTGFSENGEQSENPLIYSGLVLAGSNRVITLPEDYNSADPGSEDGILTALEVSGLNLGGTELVVLSACQTGLGEVVNGEGVFGLRRAFQHAGARSIIMSMWSVPDRQAQMLMQDFYSNWLSGNSKSDALRNACLELLSRRRAESGTAHPLFWRFRARRRSRLIND